MHRYNLIRIWLISFWFIFYSFKGDAQKVFDQIHWDSVTALPPTHAKEIQPGVAGAFSGYTNGVMIIAGGANFPDTLPWNGGIKKHWDDIFVYNWKTNKWLEQTGKLPLSIAYGASVSTDKGIFCIGGRNNDKIFSETFFLSFKNDGDSVEIRPFTPLPLPLFNLSATQIGNSVYVAGGEDSDSTKKVFFKIDISSTKPIWEPLPVWNGPSLSHVVLVTQSTGDFSSIFLIGGKHMSNLGGNYFVSTVYQYNPNEQKWTERKSITDNNNLKIKLSAGSGFAVGSNYILLVGGNTSTLYDKILELNKSIANSITEPEKEKSKQALNDFLNAHPGFDKKVYLYNTITDTWVQLEDFPFASPVTLNVFKSGDQLVLPSGEIRPGVRSPQIIQGSIKARSHFTSLDYVVLGVYSLLMLGIGYWASKRQKSTNDYFKASESIPSWAAGLSIFGTQLSAITFMAIPAKTYATNWTYFFLQMTIIMAVPFITRFFIPFYRSLNVTSAYEYLQKRFNYAVRLSGSLLFILLQTARIAIVLLLPSLALTVVTGIPVESCILLMGVITILYTFKGGIEAVIWTDVVQVIILLGGALLCLSLIPFKLKSAGQEIWSRISEFDKLKIADFSLDFTQPTIWVMLIGGLAINLVTYGSDQAIVQKYMTTKDIKGARRSLRLSAWMTIPSAFIFFGIGTMLFLFYSDFPLEANIQLKSQDAIFPWFIVSQLPSGFIGLLIAAIFAAAMSTLSSSLNSISTAIITDIYKPFAKLKSDNHFLYTAQFLTVLIGIMGTSLALWMATQGITSLWDQFNMLLGLFIGSLGGVFILGIFTSRANGTGALIGLICSGILQYILKMHTPLNFLMFAFSGAASCFTFGYLFSILLPHKKTDIDGLTIYSLRR